QDAAMEVLFGNRHEAERLVGDRTGLQAAFVLALAGSTKRAEDIANAATPPSGPDLAVLLGVRAGIELGRNNPDPAKALEALRPVEKYEPGPGTLRAIYVRGLAHLQMKSGQAAAVEFQKIIDHPGVNPVNVIHPLAQLGLARSYVFMGDNAK